MIDSFILSDTRYKTYYYVNVDSVTPTWFFLINGSYVEKLYNENKIYFTIIKIFSIINEKPIYHQCLKYILITKKSFYGKKTIHIILNYI